MRAIFISFFLICSLSANCQVVFSENMGFPATTSSIASNTFQNSGSLVYSNGTQTIGAEIRITSGSIGYPDASGGGNVFFTSSSSPVGFSIENVNAFGMASLTLQYAYRKESASALPTFAIDYWNGSSWISIANASSSLFNESATSPAGWYPAKNLTLPSAAQFNGLKIRFVKTGAVALRIDDIKLTAGALPSGPSSYSDIVFNASSSTSTNTNIDYIAYQGTSLSNTATGLNGSIGVMGFYLRDGGVGLNDPDTLSTRLTKLKVSINHPELIRAARLFVGNSPKGTAVLANGASTIVFDNITDIVANDNSQLALNLRVTFNSIVTDNAQLQFSIIEAYSSSMGSAFAQSNAGAASSSLMGDINRIEVTASKLAFLQQPTTTNEDEIMLPIPVVEARDNNGNVDIDFSSTISLTSSGSLLVSPQTVVADSGSAAFPSIIHENSAVGLVLTASSGGISSATSSPFVILTKPIFGQSFSVCRGSDFAGLPTISTNGITGSWSPAFDNLNSGTYTFIPDPGQNSSSAVLTVEIQMPVEPSFDAIAPICFGETLILPNTSLEGIQGSWAPSPNNQETTTYKFTPVSSSCANSTEITVVVTAKQIPSFEPFSPYCKLGNAEPLPGQSLEGISGTWTPLPNNQTTTTYTFLPDSPQCYESIQLTINVLDASVPTFEIPDFLCEGISYELPTTSNEGITGSWSPAFDNLNSGVYTFTPDSGQCATSASKTINIQKKKTPLFTQVASICSGDPLPTLPTTSLNDISGSWSPPIDNTVTTVYTFTPDDSTDCIEAITMTIPVDYVIPIFDLTDEFCAGDTLDPLPGTSVNNITGSWTPPLNNSSTTTYTFQPDPGQCASPVTRKLIIHELEPDFGDLLVCPGTTLSELPLVSDNGVEGRWSFSPGGVTFTPTSSFCPVSSVTLNTGTTVIPVFTAIAPIRAGDVINDLPTTSNNGITGVWTPALNNLQTTTYTFTPDSGQCATSASMIIQVNGTLVPPIPSIPPSPTGTSAEVGVTAGELSVSPSGAAVYVIPIAVPPGIKGIEPHLALTYSSQDSNGVAGFGWNLSGLSSITRIPSTKFHDGVIDPVDFDDLDRFALDGQRLLLKSGSYGAPGSLYETEIFSNIQVTYTGSYFKVDYPDGSRAYYGYSTDSKIGNLTYHLSYFENPQNIRITYTYSQISNTAYIQSITYGGVGSSIGFNKIEFTYKNRSLPEQRFIGALDIKVTKILSEISVSGKMGKFRNYVLTHDSSLKFQRLTKVTEFNGNKTKNYNPTVFEYFENEINQSFTYYQKPGYTAYLNDAPFVFSDRLPKLECTSSGDFDGDGEIDLVVANKLYTHLFDDGSIPLEFDLPGNYVGTWTGVSNIKGPAPIRCLRPLNNGYALMEKDAMCIEVPQYAQGEPVKIDFRIFTMSPGISTVSEDYVRHVEVGEQYKYVETLTGDFDGDGLTDKLVLCSVKPVSTENYVRTKQDCKVYFVSLDRRLTVPETYMRDSGTLFNVGTKPISQFGLKFDGNHVYVADANGDGKSDLYVFKPHENKIEVYSLDNNYNLTLLFDANVSFFLDYRCGNPNAGGRLEYFSESYIGSAYQFPPIIGDFNGDGKCDVLLPGWERKALMSTGVSFTQEPLGSFPERRSIGDYFPIDFDGDGKLNLIGLVNTNILRNFERKSQSNWVQIAKQLPGYDTDESRMMMVKTSKSYEGKPQLVTFKRLPYNDNDPIRSFNIGFITNHRTLAKDYLIQKFKIGNGTTDEVTYKSLVNGNGVYSSPGVIEQYPYFDILNAPGTKLVSKIENITASASKRRFFKYHGATAHVEGLDYIGFRSVASTNWFTNLNTAITTVTKGDIAKRGAVIESFSVVGNLAANTSFSTSDPFITHITYSYNNNDSEPNLLPNKVFKLRETFSQSTDGFDGVSVDVSSTYDTYNLTGRSTFVHKDGVTENKTTVENYVYTNSNNPYIIGQPQSSTVTTTLSPSGDLTKSEQEFVYNGNLLVQKKGRATNSGITTAYITETYGYDAYGNVTSKTVSAPSLADRTSTIEYDASTHRFPTKMIDVLGQANEYEYDSNTGATLTVKAPSNPGFLLKTVSTLDTWGKPIKTATYLGSQLIASETMAYANTPLGGITVTSSGNDNSGKKVTFDEQGRKIHVEAKTISNGWSCVSTLYNINNQPTKVSEPYIVSGSPGNFSLWNEMQYDIFGRLIQSNLLKSNTSNGTQVIYSYPNDGLTTIEDDGRKQKITLKDIFGNLKSLSETGSPTISHTYFANGNLKTTTMGGAITSFQQNGWGLRSQVDDPSAGVYNYTYNDLGEVLIQSIANKGVTTYGRDSFGRVISETAVGTGDDTTNSSTVYTFGTNKLLNSVTFTDNENGYTINNSYTYDNYRRLIKTAETRTHASDATKKFFDFQHEFVFDGQGRIEKERLFARDLKTNKSCEKWIKNTFKNGYDWQIFDMTSSTATSSLKVWEATAIAANGSLLTASLGNGISIANTYNSQNLPVKIKHDKNATNIITLNASFDNTYQNLSSRSYTLINTWSEGFAYDALDRITTYRDLIGIQNQSYNGNGTIASNNLGSYAYTGSDNPFRLTSITPTDQSQNSPVINYYINRTQHAKYNLSNNPVWITEEDKENIDFEYTASGDRSVMYYGDLQTSKNARTLRKFYSDDGTMEIKRKTVSGNTSNEFVFYIGGDAYSAPAILKSDGTTKSYFYLHRDYQGSIMAITDYQGAVVEKRLFDVWGGLIKYSKGNISTIPTNSSDMFIDRGYTGHEHLIGVGLINMNGRIYDPKIHRFLQPDENIQDPTNTQNYNRYGYCMNNPTRYTDPSGEFWEIAATIFNAYVHGVVATGQANPFKWSWRNFAGAALPYGSQKASQAATNYANKYIDTYNANQKAGRMEDDRNWLQRLADDNALKRLANDNALKRLVNDNALKRLAQDNALQRLQDDNMLKRTRDVTSQWADDNVRNPIDEALTPFRDYMTLFRSQADEARGAAADMLRENLSPLYGAYGKLRMYGSGSSIAGGATSMSAATVLSDDIAKTFRFGNYTEEILKEPIVLSRYYDNTTAFAKGRFMTNSISRIRLVDRIRLAIKPSFNKMTYVARWEIPAGAKVYKGPAAGILPWLGGKTQYFIPELSNIKRTIK